MNKSIVDKSNNFLNKISILRMFFLTPVKSLKRPLLIFFLEITYMLNFFTFIKTPTKNINK